MRNVYLRIVTVTPADDWSFGDNLLWTCSSRLQSWRNNKLRFKITLEKNISLLRSKTTHWAG